MYVPHLLTRAADIIHRCHLHAGFNRSLFRCRWMIGGPLALPLPLVSGRSVGLTVVAFGTSVRNWPSVLWPYLKEAMALHWVISSVATLPILV